MYVGTFLTMLKGEFANSLVLVMYIFCGSFLLHMGQRIYIFFNFENISKFLNKLLPLKTSTGNDCTASYPLDIPNLVSVNSIKSPELLNNFE
jgi:hypothetical protein